MSRAENDIISSNVNATESRSMLIADHDADGTIDQVELLDGGEQVYPRMLAAIASAKLYVRLEVYAFSPAGIGRSFVEALSQAAQRGVGIHVTIDGWGSARGGRAVATALSEAGCHVRIYHRLLALLVGRFGRNHRKILLIDDDVAFVGGINIGDENVTQGARPGWADVALEIRGSHCLRLGQMFRREPVRTSDSTLVVHFCGLGGGWRFRRRYLRAFARAHQRIEVAHGYFLPDRGIVRAIIAAAKRGVQVRLLLAGQSDVPFARIATRSLYRRLLTAGVDIHEWSGSVLHAKVACIDGCSLLVGSFNLDPFSLANREVLVELSILRVVAQGEKWIDERFEMSRAVTSVDAGSPIHRWLLEPLGIVVARMVALISRALASGRSRRALRSRLSIVSKRRKHSD